jgi:hypothetical protein
MASSKIKIQKIHEYEYTISENLVVNANDAKNIIENISEILPTGYKVVNVEIKNYNTQAMLFIIPYIAHWYSATRLYIFNFGNQMTIPSGTKIVIRYSF